MRIVPIPTSRLVSRLQHLEILLARETSLAFGGQPEFPGSVVDEFLEALEVLVVADSRRAVSLGEGEGLVGRLGGGGVAGKEGGLG